MSIDALQQLLARARRPFVLTGAGISTDSGIPAYRDASGAWRHSQPMTYQAFVRSDDARRRYWSRSLRGWRRIRDARPNAAHLALGALERMDRVHWLVTQNVDGLHQRAGSRRVIDLHGRLDAVRCLSCDDVTERAILQERLAALNPEHPRAETVDGARPDGDVELVEKTTRAFRVAPCSRCGGVLKPDVVFFGEGIPRPRVEGCRARLAESDLLVVLGSSLMVFSGYRFVRWARDLGLPTVAVTLGRTRADAELDLKVEAPLAEVLPALAAADGTPRGRSRPC